MQEKELLERAAADGIQKRVVGGVIVHRGQVLLLKRVAGDFMPGLVELPRGGVDEGDSLQKALIREVAEEVHLTLQKADIGPFIDSFDYESASGKKTRQFNFLCPVQEVADLALNPAEHEAFYWVDIHHVADSRLPISESILQTLSRAAELVG